VSIRTTDSAFPWDEVQWPRSPLQELMNGRGAASLAVLHFGSVVLVLVAAGLLSAAFANGAQGSIIARISAMLSWWVPAAVGIAGSTLPLDRRRGPRLAVWLVLFGVASMILLDLVGVGPWARPTEAVLNPASESVSGIVNGTVYPESWVRTFSYQATGGLRGASEARAIYPPRHPRILVARAVSEASGVLVMIAALGAVLVVRRWMRDNVLFRRDANEFTANVGVAWLVAPGLAALVSSLTTGRMTNALFGGGSLVEILLPAAVSATAGGIALLVAFRAPDEWAGSDP